MEIINLSTNRILLSVSCFAVMTNIATIVVLFEQLEHEAMCDEQNELNSFMEGARPLPDRRAVPPPEAEGGPIEDSKERALSILDVKGSDYRMHDFPADSVRASDWKHVLKHSLPEHPADCGRQRFASEALVSALSKWTARREFGWFPLYDCPSWVQGEYRPPALVPHIYQTQCAPFWPSDVVYLLSHTLTPSMAAIQYGFSLSTLWMANFVATVKVVDHRRDSMENYMEFLEQHHFDASNVQMRWERMSRNYVEQIGSDGAHSVDVVAVENVPEYHHDVLRYAVSVLKENDGVLVINLSAEHIPDDVEQLIDGLVPEQWMRYNSFAPDFLRQRVPFSQEQYLNRRVSIWISRTLAAPC